MKNDKITANKDNDLMFRNGIIDQLKKPKKDTLNNASESINESESNNSEVIEYFTE